MQVITCMPAATSKKSEVQGTRERLLEAAMKVFSRDGLHRATTRVIAEEAGVNEVTLFRHFQSKDGLLAAVMQEVVTAHAGNTFDDEALWTGDLHKSLLKFAKGLWASMVRDEAFIRTMMGEAKRHPDYVKTIMMDAVKPLRARFIANLEAARKAGKIRKGIDLGTAMDVFIAMLLGGMLKVTADCYEGYTPDQFVITCVDIFAAGLAAPSAKA